MEITGNIIDILERKIYPGIIKIESGRIKEIVETVLPVENQYILPGFVDAHVHIESSMLVPSEFARLAVVHGTLASVSDPHEIANVLGIEGVEYMLENGRSTPFKFYFGAPSCVPATTFETAGAIINSGDIDYLLSKPDIVYLAEMMNWPGVINNDTEVLSKINISKKYNKPIDGHAPGLRGEQSKTYFATGISTDHECFTYEEAKEKLELGVKILIREGSAAKNFEALVDLIKDYPDEIMFCSDDKHPDSLIISHINDLVKRALTKGHNIFDILKVACINPVKHYNLNVGLLQINDPADFIIVNNINDFKVTHCFINGLAVAQKGNSLLPYIKPSIINQFNKNKIKPTELIYKAWNKNGKLPVIKVIDGELITERMDINPKVSNGIIVSDLEKDILKIVVINRYKEARPSIAFIHNFGIKSGAIASSVAHDSHNIVAVGVDDESIAKAINLIIEHKGGICAISEEEEVIIPLPIAGLMSDQEGHTIANSYTNIDLMVKKMGSKLISPFMSLSFMALLVIPSIKLSDKGLFDGTNFQFIEQINT